MGKPGIFMALLALCVSSVETVGAADSSSDVGQVQKRTSKQNLVATTAPQLLADGDVVIDKRANLVWQRCMVGRRWNGNVCVGTVKMLTAPEAIEIARAASTQMAAWRVPTKHELLLLAAVVRSTGTQAPFAKEDRVSKHLYIDDPKTASGQSFSFLTLSTGVSETVFGDSGAPLRLVRGDDVSQKHQMISKQEAITAVNSSLESDSDLIGNPAKKEIMQCLYSTLVDDVFGKAQVLERDEFENHLSARVKNMSKDEKELIVVKCAVNSQAFAKAIKEKSESQSSASPTPTIPLIGLDDLRVDMASMQGKKVRVRGVGFYMMDMFMLKKSMTDMSPVLVNISNLVRDQRKEIISRCGDMMKGCILIVQGTVGKVSNQNGLLAEHVEVR